MPKVVQWEERRGAILEATMRIIAREGFQQATTRAIAREAGYSHGVLNHYFDNKSDILVSALHLCHERVRARAKTASAGLAGFAALRVSMLEELPLDATRELEAKVEVSFWHQVLDNEEAARVHAAEFEHHWDRIHGLLEEARSLGQLRQEVTVDEATLRLLILVDGISVQKVANPQRLPPETQVAVLDSVLKSLQNSPATDH
jgi:AcrR family transcriptional regulator